MSKNSRGFPCGPVGKESACNAVNLGLIPGLGSSAREGKDYPLQLGSSSCMVLEQLWGDTPGPRAEKPQQDGRHWSGSCVALEQLWGDSPHPRAKEKPQQDCRKGKITFRIKPHTCQRHSEGSNKPCVHQNPETPQRLRQNCVWLSPVEWQVSSGLLQGQGLWVPQTWVWHKPS